MKGIFTLIAILVSVQLFAQSDSTRPYTITGVVKVDSTLKKDLLYNSAYNWFVKTFNYANAVIQLHDKDAGEIAGDGAMTYVSNNGSVASGTIKYNISIWIKDGKYKYEFTNFIHNGTPSGEFPARDFGLIGSDSTVLYYNKGFMISQKAAAKGNRKDWLNVANEINSEVNRLIKSLNSAMATSSSNW